MTNTFVKARLLKASLAFFIGMAPIITATSHNSWVAQDAKNTVWRIEEFSLVGDQEIVKSNTSCQLIQVNRLSDGLSTIQLELKSDTYCELSLQDLEGNHIQTIEVEQKKKGKHLVLWRHPDVEAGTYLLTLSTKEGHEQIELLLE